jgi:putative FmdB family regulatory protein
MPIYEFVCNSCGKEFETITSSAAVSDVTCDACDSKDVRKILSATSFKVGSGGSALPSMAPGGCGGGSGFS